MNVVRLLNEANLNAQRHTEREALKWAEANRQRDELFAENAKLRAQVQEMNIALDLLNSSSGRLPSNNSDGQPQELSGTQMAKDNGKMNGDFSLNPAEVQSNASKRCEQELLRCTQRLELLLGVEKEVVGLRAQLHALTIQHDLLLQMYGQLEEELRDVKDDAETAKTALKQQVQALGDQLALYLQEVPP
jgi:hypothetical protein